MDRDGAWHPEVLPSEAHDTLARLGAHPSITPFYLAGGTALALQWGHRKSIDLDFFSEETVNEDLLLGSLQQLPELKVISKSPESLNLHIGITKASFLAYHYPVLFPFSTYRDVNVADPQDIAAMKVSAVSSRGTKRDFIDLYVLSQRYGLEDLLALFERKFTQVRFNRIHVLKSLTYFADADKEPMPRMLKPLVWNTVKEFFLTQAPRLRIRQQPN